jgi:hypothetical protein
LISEVLILLGSLLVENGVSDEYLGRTVERLVKKFVSVEGEKVSERSLKLVFDFIALVWQRKTHLMRKEIIESLCKDDGFCRYMK